MNIRQVGSRIRQRRRELGVDQRSLAELAEISIHTVSDIESGKANPTLDTLSQVLDVLGLELKIVVQSPRSGSENDPRA